MHVGGCVDCVHGVCGMCTCVCVCLCLCVCAHRILLFTEYLTIIRVWGGVFNSNYLFVV